MLLKIKDLSFSYHDKEILHHFDLNLPSGKSVAIVGESGCGKSTLAQLILGWLIPDEGEIWIDQVRLNRQNRTINGEALDGVQVILQNIEESLNPRMTAYQLIEEPLHYQQMFSKSQYETYVNDIVKRVGLDTEVMDKFPDEFSGGQKQRIAIARSLVLRPKLLISDESTSNLDSTVAKSILHMMKNYIANNEMALVFITHDIAIAKWLSDEMIVMYKGRIVERIASVNLLENAIHPYTKRMIAASKYDLTEVMSDRKSPNRNRIVLCNENGCVYHENCSSVMSVCREKTPEKRMLSSDHEVSCFLTD
jgi:oligopeptide/dipeptide ABC transporter ATP-binding protein